MQHFKLTLRLQLFFLSILPMELDEKSKQLISEIGDRKQSERMARHSQQKLIDITNNIPGVVFQFQVSQNNVFFTYIWIKILSPRPQPYINSLSFIRAIRVTVNAPI